MNLREDAESHSASAPCDIGECGSRHKYSSALVMSRGDKNCFEVSYIGRFDARPIANPFVAALISTQLVECAEGTMCLSD